MRTIGIEFEFGNKELDKNDITRDDIKEILKDRIKHFFNKNKINLRSGPHGHKKYWSFYDYESCGYEFRTPALEASLENIEKISKMAQSFHHKLGENLVKFVGCGLHIHIDISDFTKQQVFNLYRLFYIYEESIYKLFKKERKRSTCVLSLKNGLNVKNLLLEEKNRLNTHELAVNIRSTRIHKIERIEIRYCHGTLNYDTIYFWTLLLLFLIESSKENNININKEIDNNSIDNLMIYIKKSKLTNSFLSRKRKKINDWIFYRFNNRENN